MEFSEMERQQELNTQVMKNASEAFQEDKQKNIRL